MSPSLRRLRSLSRRDAVVAGGTLALVAVTVLAVFVFFPRHTTPRPLASALWPGRAEQLGPLDEVPAWQQGRVLIELRHFSPQTSAQVQVDSQGAGGISVDAQGEGRGRVLLPAGVGAGLHELIVQDSGTGNDAAPLRVQVLRERPPVLWAGPRPLPKRAVLLVASGFTPGARWPCAWKTPRRRPSTWARRRPGTTGTSRCSWGSPRASPRART